MLKRSTRQLNKIVTKVDNEQPLSVASQEPAVGLCIVLDDIVELDSPHLAAFVDLSLTMVENLGSLLERD